VLLMNFRISIAQLGKNSISCLISSCVPSFFGLESAMSSTKLALAIVSNASGNLSLYLSACRKIAVIYTHGLSHFPKRWTLYR
jgi:hypothetical protein